MTTNSSDNFLWGAAIAAHQVEGHNHNQWTVWEYETAAQKAREAVVKFKDFPIFDSIQDVMTKPETYVSGVATDHYNRYEEDFALLSSMNMNALRFSIEWSRIEPEKGMWDEAAIQYYRNYILSLKSRNIEPIATLFHFTLPAWFSAMGGFEERSNVDFFTRFVEKIITELGSELRYVITINEPEVYTEESYITRTFPPQQSSKLTALRVFRNLVKAHNDAARTIKKRAPHTLVSLAKNSAHYHTEDTTVRSKVVVAALTYLRDIYFLNRTAKTCDFIALNYYFSNRIVNGKMMNENKKVHDLGWQVKPADIKHVISRLHEKYKMPIFITENGLADQNDTLRKWWITETLDAIDSCTNTGIPVMGYLHWSLTDNFEWGFGTIPRFGLASIDYTTQQRTLRPSAIWFGEEIKRRQLTQNQPSIRSGA